MSPAQYQIAPLDLAKDDRGSFDCGVAELTDYLRERAGQDMRRHAAGCWVLFHKDRRHTILGYYSLSPESVEPIPKLVILNEVKNL